MAGHAENSWTTRVADVWGHIAHEILCLSIVTAVVVGLRPPTGLLAVSVSVSLIVLVVTSWLLMRRHDRRLCEQCVAAMPLNVAEKSVRYRRRFWMAHTGVEPRFLVPYLAVLLGSNLFAGTWGRIAWAVLQCSMVYLIISHVTHRRFQPWCPRCRNGGGGRGFDDEVTPPPMPRNDRQLV